MKYPHRVLLTACLSIIFAITSSAQQWSTNASGIHYNAGNVGIGTTSPIGKLSITSTGTIGITPNFSNSYLYMTDGTQELGLDPNQIFSSVDLNIATSLNNIHFSTTGSRRVTINSARTGIGNDATDITGTALDQLVIGDGLGSQGIVIDHGTNNDAAIAFAKNGGSLSGRILYRAAQDEISIQHAGVDKINVSGNLVDFIPDVEMDGRLYFGDFTSQGVGTIQIKKEGPNEGITLWTESGIVTKRMWIDDATNTLQLTAGNNLNNGLSIDDGGRVGIGTSTGSYKLEVNGTIRSKEVIVEATSWPDYVFQDDYNLKPILEVESYINEFGHLPEIPSATEVEESGQHLGETQQLLLQKIEELTLYVIDLKKENIRQQATIDSLISVSSRDN